MPGPLERAYIVISSVYPRIFNLKNLN
jgi:hypothetical protein